MARDLRIIGAHIHRPDRRLVRCEDLVGESVVLAVVSEDLKAKPVHQIPLTDAQALRLAEQLLASVRRRNGAGPEV